MPFFFWALTLAAQLAVTPLVVVWAHRSAGLSRGWTAALTGALTAWFVLAILASETGVFHASPDRMPIMGFVIVGTVAGGELALLRAGARVPERALAALMALQMVRLTGYEFVPVYQLGLLPAHFSLPAGIGDAFIGVTAPLMAFVVARRLPGWRRLALVWNLLGVLDLVIATAMGVLSAPGPQRLFMGEPSTAWLLRLPLSMIPAFGVPLAVLGHFLAIGGLRHVAPRGDLLIHGASASEDRGSRRPARPTPA
jgi:hypothetical protein